MKNFATLLFFNLFTLSAIFSQVGTDNNVSFLLDEDNINDIIQHILCEYNIGIEDEELATFLMNLLNEGEGCGEVLAYHSSSTENSDGFHWDKIPGADNYRVASLGLGDGSMIRKSTKKPDFVFKPLTIQPYIFAFIADCAGTLGIASIIIVDKDVGLMGQTHSPLYNCECQDEEQSIAIDASCPEINSYFFPWSNYCNLNKYKYYVNGFIGETSYSQEFWSIYAEEQIEDYNGNLMFMKNCDENYIENEYPGGPGAIGDPGNFMVNFSSLGTHIYVVNQALNITSVNASICGCIEIEDLPKNRSILKEDLTEFEVFPNPFDHQLQIKLPIDLGEGGNISIFDQYGKLVHQEMLSSKNAGNNFKILADDFQSGIYYVKLEHDDRSSVKKIVKM